MPWSSWGGGQPPADLCPIKYDGNVGHSSKGAAWEAPGDSKMGIAFACAGPRSMPAQDISCSAGEEALALQAQGAVVGAGIAHSGSRGWGFAALHWQLAMSGDVRQACGTSGKAALQPRGSLTS